MASRLLYGERMNQNIEMLGKLMDITAQRQRVLSNNLANANTPGYIRKDIFFRDAMTRAIKSGSAMSKVQPKIRDDHSQPGDDSGNNVALQKELGEMTQNSLLYNFAAEMAGRKFASLSKAISGTK